MRLLDTRFAGLALGVGQARILGRIHSFQIDILDKKVPASLTVLEDDKIDFLLGLDMLKRYQCLLNLKESNLTFNIGNEKLIIPFLSEHQIHRTVSISHEKQALEDEKMQAEGIEKGAQQPRVANAPNPAPQTQVRQPVSANSNSAFSEQQIKTLTDLGASRPEAIQTLQQCGGNIEYAASIIANKYMGF